MDVRTQADLTRYRIKTVGLSETELWEKQDLERKRIERDKEASAEAEIEDRLYSIPQDTIQSVSESTLEDVTSSIQSLLISTTDEDYGEHSYKISDVDDEHVPAIEVDTLDSTPNVQKELIISEFNSTNNILASDGDFTIVNSKQKDEDYAQILCSPDQDTTAQKYTAWNSDMDRLLLKTAKEYNYNFFLVSEILNKTVDDCHDRWCLLDAFETESQ